MYSVDDYFEYVTDLPPQQRDQVLAELRGSDPGLAAELERRMATNPEFVCRSSAPASTADRQSRLLGHAIPVRDLDRAIQWYGEVFGCRLLQRHGLRAEIGFATGSVWLDATADTPPTLSVAVASLASLTGKNPPGEGPRRLRLVDPWGNAIEAIET